MGNKQNRIPIEYDLFQRVDEDTSIEKIGNGVVATLDDMVLNNPYGSASIRGAYTLKNNFQPTNSIKRIIDVRDEDNQEWFIAGNGALLSRSVGGTWANIKTGLTGTGNFQFTQIPKGIVFTNGADKPFILSGSDFSVDDNVEIEPPDVSGITAQRTTDASGSLRASSAYRWILVYKTEVGEISNVSASFTFSNTHSTYSQTTNSTNLKFLFRQLPVSTDSRVTHKVLYRTEGWVSSEKLTGLIYYRVTDLQNDITLYVDDVADEDLDFSDTIRFVRLPNDSEYTTRSNNRLWFANYTLPKISQNRPPVTCLPHGSASVYPAGGANWGDSSLVTKNLEVTADVVSVTGLIPNYYYQYMYTYIDFNDIESRPSYGTSTFQVGSAVNGGSYHKVTTALYDSGRVGSNQSGHKSPSVKARRIYRTLGHVADFTANTEPFYLVEEQLIDTSDIGSKISTSYVDDNMDDSTTVYAEATESQISAVAWSKVDRPAYFDVGDVKQIFAEEQGDPITGFLDDGNGVLIWKENSIIKLYHTGAPQNWYLRKVWNEHGCDEPLSLIKAGDTYFFSFRKKIYSMVSGQAPVDISYGRYATFNDLDILNVVGNDLWIIYTCTDSTNQYQMVYDRIVKTWYKFNFGTTDLTCSMIKKYDEIWVGYKNLPFAVVGRRMFDYDDTVTNDEISGGTVAIDPSLTLPLFKLKGTHSKIRNIVLDWVNTGTGTLKLTLVSDAGTTVSNITNPDDTGLTRLVTSLTSLPSSNNFKLKMSGIISQLNSVRIDLRPSRQGVGV
jgi:hypothetical protein